MRSEIIEARIKDWQKITEDTKALKSVDFVRIQDLLKKTYDIIDDYRELECLRRQLRQLIPAMCDFASCVRDSCDTLSHDFFKVLESRILTLMAYLISSSLNISYNAEKLKIIAEGRAFEAYGN